MGMNESVEMTSAPCPECGKIHEFDTWMLVYKKIPLCDPCEEIRNENERKRRAPKTWDDKFGKRMPLDYQRAETGRIAHCYTAALDWTAEAYRGGVGLIGPSGLGKSCAMACLLRKLETDFIWWSGTEAREVATLSALSSHSAHEESYRKWQKALTTPILMLDDVSQGRMTEAWSSKLFDLMEMRKSRCLPTFWTSQLTLPELREKMARQNGNDTAQAEATSRRLAQHSLVLLG
ncbi:MAG: hypothetical protein EOP85_07510 [Verrucomicrobiaceae bacterium]|nr:MAG: hypothetical protein EOP85_07510 [Verrucomicrobiaceae bacterium]